MFLILGELSPMQESKLVQLKSRVSELLKGKVPSDPVFLRFLRARDFNVDKVFMKNQRILLLYAKTITITYHSLLIAIYMIQNMFQAREMLSQSLIWRKKHGVDKILSEYELPMVAKEYFPGERQSYHLLH